MSHNALAALLAIYGAGWVIAAVLSHAIASGPDDRTWRHDIAVGVLWPLALAVVVTRTTGRLSAAFRLDRRARRQARTAP